LFIVESICFWVKSSQIGVFCGHLWTCTFSDRYFISELGNRQKKILIKIKRILKIIIFIINHPVKNMEKKKESKEDYATKNPTDANAKSQEDLAKKAIKKFKSLG